MKYTMTEPCVDCPFRISRKFPLEAARKREISAALLGDRATFPCHKTVDYEKSDGGVGHISQPEEVHCAGALILLEREGRPSQMMRIAERLGMYDMRKLDVGHRDIFETFAQWKRATR